MRFRRISVGVPRTALGAVLCALAMLVSGLGVPAQAAEGDQACIDILSVTPAVVSPNGDGRHEVFRVKAKVTQYSGQTLRWKVQGIDLNNIITPLGPWERNVSADVGADGVVEFPVNVYAKAREVLASSSQERIYFVSVVSSGAENASCPDTDEPSALLNIDTTPTVITSVAARYTTFYPARDRYRDSIKLRLGFHNPVQGHSVKLVHRRTGKVMRVVDLVTKGTRSAYFVWNGRTKGGRLAPAGRYQLVVRSEDTVGNRRTQALNPRTFGIQLSHKELVAKTWRRTVSAQRSVFRDDSGRCSVLRKPGVRRWAGSVGYYSQQRCKGSGMRSRMAAAVHRVRLPAAPRYGTVQISAYGGEARPRTGHRASFGYFLRDGSVSKANVLGYAVGNHATTRRRAAALMNSKRQVHWSVATAYGQKYDVKSFTVRLKYWALR
jgi:hypothetical protein